MGHNISRMTDDARKMTDDARKQWQERLARVGAKAIARLHEKRPELQGKTLEETVFILKEEVRLTRSSRA